MSRPFVGIQPRRFEVKGVLYMAYCMGFGV